MISPKSLKFTGVSIQDGSLYFYQILWTSCIQQRVTSASVLLIKISVLIDFYFSLNYPKKQESVFPCCDVWKVNFHTSLDVLRRHC